MKENLYLKTLIESPEVVYFDKAIRISRRHIIIGLCFFTTAVFLGDPEASMVFHVGLLLGTTILIALFLALRIKKIQPDIASAVSGKQNIAKTKYLYDGSKKAVSTLLNTTLGTTIGICIVAFVGDFSWSHNLYSIIFGFASGYFFGVGLKYMYWEYKFDRKILVYKYDLKK